MKNTHNLPPALQQEVEWFFEYAPPQRLSRNLRRLFLGYLSHQQDGHCMNIDDLVADLQLLLDMLDRAADELPERDV